MVARVNNYLDGLQLIDVSFKKKLLISFLCGVLAVYGFAPFTFYIAISIAYSGFYLLLNYSKSRIEAALISTCFGFGLFFFGLHWVVNALFFEFDKFWFLIPIALIVLPIYKSIYFFVFGYLSFSLFKNCNEALRLISLAVLYSFIELIGSFGKLALPWFLLGYSAPTFEMMQFTNLISINGMSFLFFILYSYPGFMLICFFKKKNYYFFNLSILCVFLAIYTYGFYVVSIPTKFSNNKVLLVQGNNKNQEMNWRNINNTIKSYIELTLENSKDVDLIVWPESAIKIPIDRDNRVNKTLSNILNNSQKLIVGVATYTKSNDSYKFYNSSLLIDRYKIVEIYDKIKLVPFGEFVPYRNILPIDKVTPGSLDYNHGYINKDFKVNDIVIKPLICFEVLFNNLIQYNSVSDLIVNITNDSWYGQSIGPFQHFQIARFRAVEIGVPLVRVANTGISAILDHRGKVIQYLKYNTKGFLKDYIPVREKYYFNSGQTLYYKYLLFITILIIWLSCNRKNI